MAKKHSGLSKAAVLAAGVGAAAFAAKKHTDHLAEEGQTLSGEIKEAVAKTAEKTIKMPAPDPSYRNTERGKYEKNSKGIYYTNGNYEAFARPEKPEGVENKSAYLVGSGLASLAAACFLVRDGQMPGKNIHILEAMDIAGGACDGINDPIQRLCDARRT